MNIFAACPVNFENENYTIVTSQCKGPVYKRDLCCNSFLQIACPYWEHINDEKTNCASTLFSYINLYGKYPPGLFSSMCKGGKDGLSCDHVHKPASQNPSTGQAAFLPINSPLLMIAIELLVFIHDLF